MTSPQPEQLDVRPIGALEGYDIEQIKGALAESVGQLHADSQGGVFVAGTASAFRKEVLVAIVHRLGDNFTVGLKVKASTDEGASVGFSLAYEW